MREGFEVISGAKTGRILLFGALIALAAALGVVFMTRNSPESPTASADSLSAPLNASAEAGFIRIEGIMGESDDKVHQGWIDLESFSHSISAPVPSTTGGAGGAGAATVRDFVFTKKVDKASPLLMEAALSGQQIAVVTFEVVASGDKPLTYLKYEFTDVVITNYRVGGASSGDVLPTESITFAFTKIKVTYTPQDGKGLPGEPVEVGWDVAENKKM